MSMIKKGSLSSAEEARAKKAVTDYMARPVPHASEDLINELLMMHPEYIPQPDEHPNVVQRLIGIRQLVLSLRDRLAITQGKNLNVNKPN